MLRVKTFIMPRINYYSLVLVLCLNISLRHSIDFFQETGPFKNLRSIFQITVFKNMIMFWSINKTLSNFYAKYLMLNLRVFPTKMIEVLKKFSSARKVLYFLLIFWMKSKDGFGSTILWTYSTVYSKDIGFIKKKVYTFDYFFI